MCEWDKGGRHAGVQTVGSAVGCAEEACARVLQKLAREVWLRGEEGGEAFEELLVRGGRAAGGLGRCRAEQRVQSQQLLGLGAEAREHAKQEAAEEKASEGTRRNQKESEGMRSRKLRRRREVGRGSVTVKAGGGWRVPLGQGFGHRCKWRRRSEARAVGTQRVPVNEKEGGQGLLRCHGEGRRLGDCGGERAVEMIGEAYGSGSMR